MEYEKIRRRLLGAAYIAGPLLLLISALTLFADIGRNPGSADYGSSVEGVIGFFGFIALVPVFLSLATILGQWRPRLAGVAAVIALVGFAGGGVMNMTLRAMTGTLAEVGVDEATFDAVQAEFESGGTAMAPLLVTGPLAPLASLLLGVGLLLARHMPLQAWLLVAAGVLLPAGQLLTIATDATYTIAVLLWAIALVPMGLRMLRRSDTDPIPQSRPGPITA